jgi:hypothetical protein
VVFIETVVFHLKFELYGWKRRDMEIGVILNKLPGVADAPGLWTTI